MVGHWLEWRRDEVWDSDTGFVSTTVCAGEYIKINLPGGRREFKGVWTGARWTLEKDESWMGGPYYRRNNCMFSHRDPELKIELSAKAKEYQHRLRMLAGRPVYRDDARMVRDATNDDVLFDASHFWYSDAGLAVEHERKLRFTDGVRKDLPLGYIGPYERVDFLRVSETEYSLRKGSKKTGYRYFLLDTANWTCI